MRSRRSPGCSGSRSCSSASPPQLQAESASAWHWAALLRRPQAFLLDEPLSNLDAALRVQMRVELKRIHAQFPVTTVYVTHDQVEAMTMADRDRAHAGRPSAADGDAGTPLRPPGQRFRRFVHRLPKINLFPGTLCARVGDQREVPHRLPEPERQSRRALARSTSESVTVGFRPEEIRLASGGSGGNAGGLVLVSRLVEPLGSETHVVARVGDQP